MEFGDFVEIEQKRYGERNERYRHKVIGTKVSNAWVDVPVQAPPTESIHTYMDNVVGCIVCGVDEREVLFYRESDVHMVEFPKP